MAEARGKGLPTIYDVARECGVATSTVSRALSQPGRVSAQTSEKVREAAARLGYVANPLAKHLPTGRTGTIVLTVSDIANPVFSQVIRGAEAAASRAGYTMVLTDVEESPERERQILEKLIPAVDGVALATSRLSDAAIRAVARRCPLVTMNRVTQQVPSVVPDNDLGMRRAVKHLVELGHQAVTYVAGPRASWADSVRWNGLKAAAGHLGVQVRRAGPEQPTVAGGRRIAADLESAARMPTAVVAYNDLMAIGIMQGLQAAGHVVPDEVSVIGCDNILGSDWRTPALTTVAAPLRELGSASVRHLLALIDGKDIRQARPVVLPTRLIVRESTAPPRK